MRYLALRDMLKKGEITQLIIHPKWVLSNLYYFSGRKVTYTADFSYLDGCGNLVVEDVKGFKKGAPWDLFQIKAALLLREYGIHVNVV